MMAFGTRRQLWIVAVCLCNITAALALVLGDVDSSQNGLLILGLGRVGRTVAELALPHFTKVVGTVRSSPSSSSSSSSSTTAAAKEHPTLISTKLTEASALQTIEFDLEQIRPHLPHTSHILVTIPPQKDPNEQIKLDQVYQTIMQSALVASRCPCWIGIVSTAGVYGDHQGAWVTEDDTVLQSSDVTARRYVDYEEQWKRSVMEQQRLFVDDTNKDPYKNDHSLSSTRQSSHCLCLLRIFRCAGIYGPQQSALHTIWRQRQQGNQSERTRREVTSTKIATTSTSTASDGQPPPPSAPSDLINRIHITDLARAVVSSMLLPIDNCDDKYIVRVYNLADDLPESRSVVLKYAAELLQTSMKRLADDAEQGTEKVQTTTSNSSNNDTDMNNQRATQPQLPTPPSRRRLDCKRVSNQRMKKELLLLEDGHYGNLMFPTYREGLRHILQDPTAPWWKNVKTATTTTRTAK